MAVEGSNNWNNYVYLKPSVVFFYTVWQWFLTFQWLGVALWKYFRGLDIPFKEKLLSGMLFSFLKHVYLLI